MNARLAARLTGWKIDIQSDTEFARAEADIAFGGGSGEEGEDISGRCSAVLSNGKRCPNAALPGSRFCGVPSHQALEGTGSDRIGGEPEPELEIEAETAVDGDEPEVSPEAGAAPLEEVPAGIPVEASEGETSG
jgi:transcription termination/antitermination protein NusA